VEAEIKHKPELVIILLQAMEAKIVVQQIQKLNHNLATLKYVQQANIYVCFLMLQFHYSAAYLKRVELSRNFPYSNFLPYFFQNNYFGNISAYDSKNIQMSHLGLRI
jgi:hypothetical protein